jgi:hydrogenase expression/formation protein HypE
VPKSRYDHVLLGHGSGGQMTADLIQRLFVPGFGGDVLGALEDQATLGLGLGDKGVKAPRIAFTTDSFVVRPLFFPGGDIGRLAVHGTVNDLAVGGARPLFLSAAFILEEGLPLADLQRIVASMRRACDEAGVALVTGDTKVVDRGKGDGVYITTSGIGLVPEGRSLSIHAARPGDRILLSGTVGDHGIAIMSVREGIEFETVLESDTAPLTGLTEAVLAASPRTRCMRDPTRGGLSSALNELVAASGVGVALDEGGDPAAARGPGRLRDARARPALRRQRGETDRRRPAGGRRARARRGAGPPPGTRRRPRRHGGCRSPRHGHPPVSGGR